MNDKVIENMQNRNRYLGQYACRDEEAIYFNEFKEDIRTSFFHDIDRILYTLGYTRYMDKTQVFTGKANDHLSKRMTHVQFVSKIARTIGRGLGLNEDLIEAAALGHDLGHVPYGHVGEYYLNELSIRYNAGFFNHNIQSVRLLKNIENYGKGCNLSIQVLDAIMCHNGEFLMGEYHPTPKTSEEFLKEYERSYYDSEFIKTLKPMTLEGCVVRISDMIAYLGRDIDDAVKLDIIKYEDIPSNIKEVLGSNNSDIINTIVLDILNNSVDKNYIKISDNVYEAIKELKDFNYKNIYAYSYTDNERESIQYKFEKLFTAYLNDLKTNNEESVIISHYLDKMSDEYKNNSSNERIVIDYIAGMTDEYFNKQYDNLL